VLDLYIALKVREDVWMDETELHLERDESFKDLFDLMQPRSRTEDLVEQYGAEAKLITMSPTSGRSVTPIPFSDLTVSFSPRKVRSPNELFVPRSRTTLGWARAVF
jgi:hypothetical protein